MSVRKSPTPLDKPIIFSTPMILALLAERKSQTRRFRPFAIGGRLWVKETFSESPLNTYYRATEADPRTVKWISPRFMPRRASRLTLEVTGIKVERVQEISEEDAEAEGMSPQYLGDNDPPFEETPVMISRARQFRNLWNSIHGLGAWEANPWVYAISFKTHKRNIDNAI